MDIMDIPEDEFNRYYRLLIPRLLRYKPREWVPIAILAKETQEEKKKITKNPVFARLLRLFKKN